MLAQEPERALMPAASIAARRPGGDLDAHGPPLGSGLTHQHCFSQVATVSGVTGAVGARILLGTSRSWVRS